MALFGHNYDKDDCLQFDEDSSNSYQENSLSNLNGKLKSSKKNLIRMTVLYFLKNKSKNTIDGKIHMAKMFGSAFDKKEIKKVVKKHFKKTKVKFSESTGFFIFV